jgi:hypothetical protein
MLDNVSALSALEKAAHDSEPLIAGHAHWAMAQITCIKNAILAENKSKMSK